MSALFRNQKLEVENGRRLTVAGDSPLLPLVKVTPNHANQPPGAAALQALQQPVPIGTRLPDLSFFPAAGISRAALTGLTVAQINDLEWFYNEGFPAFPSNAVFASRTKCFREARFRSW
eukprot:3513533-Rhodomonas_salina.1